MAEKQTVTVAGVPVTVQAADGALTVTIGRFDPAAVGSLLHLHPRFGTATACVYTADETGDTTHRPDHRWFSGLYPGPRGATESIRLCDGCFTAATGLLAECDDGCPQDPGHAGLCLRTSPDECQWCGTPGRLHEASRADIEHLRSSAKNTRACGSCTLPTASGALPLGAGGLGRLARQPWPRLPAPARHGPTPRGLDRSSGRSRTGDDRP